MLRLALISCVDVKSTSSLAPAGVATTADRNRFERISDTGGGAARRLLPFLRGVDVRTGAAADAFSIICVLRILPSTRSAFSGVPIDAAPTAAASRTAVRIDVTRVVVSAAISMGAAAVAILRFLTDIEANEVDDASAEPEPDVSAALRPGVTLRTDLAAVVTWARPGVALRSILAGVLADKVVMRTDFCDTDTLVSFGVE